MLALGPTVYILSLSVNSVGLFFDDFFRMSIWTALMVAGRFETIKSLTVVMSLSSIPVLFMMCYTLYRWSRQDFPDLAIKTVHTLDG